MQDGSRSTLQAIGLVCLAGLLFVVMNALVKALTATFHPVMLIWARCFFHVLVVVLLFPGKVPSILGARQKRVHVARGALLMCSTVLNFVALVFMPLGDVASITFTSPIMVAALAVLVLGERVGAWRWLAILAGFAGTLLVVRPVGAEVNIGAFLAFGCAACYAVYQISTRIVRETEPIVSLFYAGFVGTVVFSLLVPFWWQPPTLAQWGLFALVGAMGALGHLLVIMALQRGEASRISPFNYIQLVWAMAASWLVFGDVPSRWTLLGSGIIVASGLSLVWLGQREQRRVRLAARPGE